MNERQEAIILHALPYRDYDKILTLFTKDLGIVKAVVYRAIAKKAIPGATDPLTRIEIMLTEGRGGLHKSGDISVLSQHLKLRENLSRLRAGCAMAQIIHQSQLPHKPAPNLYALLLGYLAEIPQSKNLSVLVDSFNLKVLRHEGHLHIQSHCSTCREYLSNGFIAKGESLCPAHAPSQALPVTIEELKCLHNLVHSQSFQEIENLIVPPSLSLKIGELRSNLLFT